MDSVKNERLHIKLGELSRRINAIAESEAAKVMSGGSFDTTETWAQKKKLIKQLEQIVDKQEKMAGDVKKPQKMRNAPPRT